MSWSRFTFILFAVVVAAPLTHASAQDSKRVVRDPGDPKVAVPQVRYESAFARYRPNAEAEVGAWRDTNDNVGRIGGWRIYGREAIAEPKAEDQPPAADGRTGSGPSAKPKHGHEHREAR